jgi:hypothetical protein
MVVNAPGVAPEQSTTALLAWAATGSNSEQIAPVRNLNP